MDKFGSVHSDGKKILPIGKKLSLRCMIDDWQKGAYWQRSIAYHDDCAGYMYPSKRTYLQQLQDAVKEGCTELNLVIDTAGFNYSDVDKFAAELIKKSRDLGYRGEIIIDGFNEPLEKFPLHLIDGVNLILSKIVQKYNNVSLAVGDMAADFYVYYNHLLFVPYKYKYISFHTDNDCNVFNLNGLLKDIPEKIPLINNEHYCYNGAQHYGYDDNNVVDCFKKYTLALIDDPGIKSIYIACPYGVQGSPFGDKLFLNRVDCINKEIYTTKAWNMLKEFDIESEVIMKLETLRKGSHNWQVRVLQSCLKLNGVELEKVDNDFGKLTETALKIFNYNQLIDNPGVCGLDTWLTFLISPDSREVMLDFIEMLKIL